MSVSNDDLQKYIDAGGFEEPMEIEQWGEGEMPDEGTPEYDEWLLEAYKTGYHEQAMAYIGEQGKVFSLDKKVEKLEKENTELKSEIEKLQAELKAFHEAQKLQKESQKGLA